MLTGPVHINGTSWGFPSPNLDAEAAWVDEGTYVTYASGRVERVRAAWRLAGRFGFEALTGADLAQLKGQTDEPFVLTLRARREGDTADPGGEDPSTWPELHVVVRRTSPIEETGPLLRRKYVAGRVQTVYAAVVEFESVATVAEVPGALDGGFSLLSSGTFPVTGYDGPNGSAWPEHEVEAWGDATLAPATWTLDVDGTEMTVEVYEVGPPALAGLVLAPAGLHVYHLDVSGNLRLGPREAFAALLEA